MTSRVEQDTARRSTAPAAVVARDKATAATGRAFLGSQAPEWDS